MSAAEMTEAPASVVPQDHIQMSYEEWLSWDYERSLSEWVNGEVIVMSPPTVLHQLILGFLATILHVWVEIMRNGRVLQAPVGMRIALVGSVREPDLLYVAEAHTDRITRRQLEGPADLVMEIVSEESINRDRSEKFYEYQAGGVREYWIIDPREGQQRVDVWVLDETNRHKPIPPETGGIYRSHVIPGFWLREAWLWQAYPDSLAALIEMVGVERMQEVVRGYSVSRNLHND